MRSFQICALALLLTCLGTWGTPLWAEDSEEPQVAPVYLIISLDSTFMYEPGSYDEQEEYSEGQFSTTILVNIGQLNPGQSIGGTRFLPPETAPTVPLPEGTSLNDLNGNAVTVVGSVCTTTPGSEGPRPHMMTPMQAVPEAPIPDAVQAAVFAASAAGALDALLNDGEGGTYFPTTEEIVNAIGEYMDGSGEEGEVTAEDLQAIADHLFASSQTLQVSGDGEEQPLVAIDEGDMFPHSPGGAIFHYSFSFDEDGEFDADLCLQVVVDIKPGNADNVVNYKKKGALKIAILSTDDFDASEVDGSTMKIGSVSANKAKVKDVNDDGLDDMELEWRVEDLADEGEIDADTTSLTLHGMLNNGVDCIYGTDFISHPGQGG